MLPISCRVVRSAHGRARITADAADLWTVLNMDEGVQQALVAYGGTDGLTLAT